MPNITATFANSTDANKYWTILDLAIDPNNAAVIFNGYLAPGNSTGALTLYSSDGINGRAQYTRSDGSPTVVDGITDQSQIQMS
jgi:hypothetical protein